jgi:hypothetical protein
MLCLTPFFREEYVEPLRHNVRSIYLVALACLVVSGKIFFR